MNTLILSDNSKVVTMSSLELVGFINLNRGVRSAVLRHDHFMDKVPVVLGEEHAPKFRGIYFDAYEREKPCYQFPKREACLMAMSYSYDLQAKVFDKMTELEARLTIPAPADLSVMDILHIAMESDKGRLLALEQRDHAIATKAQIGSRREATAMATASAAKKESSALKEQLGFGANFATVTAVQNATGEKFDWLPMRRWCKAHATPANNVQDKRYGTVKAWPAGAWANVFGVDLMDLFGEVAA